MKRLLFYFMLLLGMIATAMATDFTITNPITITNVTVSTTTTGYTGNKLITEYSVTDIDRYVYQYYILNAESDDASNLGLAKVQLTYDDGTKYNMTTSNFPYNTPTNYTLTNPNPNKRVSDITFYKVQNSPYGSTITGAKYSYYLNLDNDMKYINTSTVSIGLNSSTDYDYFLDLNLNATARTYNDGTGSGFTRNDGTVSGGLTIEDGAMKFDGGTGYVDFSLSKTGDFNYTLCGWGKLNDNSLGNNYKLFSFSNSGTTGDFITLRLNPLNNQVNTEISDVDSSTTTLTTSWSDFNNYNLYCIEKESTNYSIFINDNRVYSTLNTIQNNFLLNVFSIGALERTTISNYFNGSIPNIIIYYRALSNTEISEIYAAGKDAYTPISNGLVAQYTGKDYAGTTSAPTIIYDSNMLSKGQDISWQNRTSTAMNFDGSQTVDLGDLNYLDNLNSGTVCFTTKLNNFTTTDRILLEKWSNDWFTIFLNDEGSGNNRIQTYWKTSTGTYGVLNGNINTLNDNQYHTICSVYENGVGVKLYEDGVQAGTTTSATGTIYAGSVHLTIGSTDTSSLYYNGIIDQIKIYNRSLNSTEIQALYTGTQPVLNGIVWSQGDYDIATNTLLDGLYRVCVDCTSYDNSFYNLSEDTYSLFVSTLSTNTSAYFTIDLTAPTINNSIPLAINDYEFLDTFFSCSDTYLASCNITIDSLNKEQGTNFTLTHNGNLSYTITAVDLAGNTATDSGVLFVNPTFTIDFINSSGSPITNFTINETSYNNIFNGTIYDYGLGTFNFLFSKAGYINTEFQLVFNTTSDINTTFTIGGAYIIVNIYDIDTGNFSSPNNFTLFFLNEDDGISQIYDIINNNTVSFSNLYEANKSIKLNLFNSNLSLVSTRQIVSLGENVTINLYITDITTQQRTIEVLTANLIQISNSDVYLYVNIPSTNNFVLQTVKKTDIYGDVVFNIIPNQYVYNICNTYNGVQKCLNQLQFDSTTLTYQLIHDSEVNTTLEVSTLSNVIWNMEEDKGKTYSYMTMTFEDTSALTSSFCFNVSRFTNSTESVLGAECNANSVGQVSQNYSLGENQYLKYTFYYISDDKTTILKTYTSFYEDNFLTMIKNLGIYVYIFLMAIIALIGFLLERKSKIFYSVGFIGGSLLIYSLQSYLSYEFIIIIIWSILVMNHVIFWWVSNEE